MTLSACLFLASLPATSYAATEVEYHLTPLPDEGRMAVVLKSTMAGKTFSVPSWREGDYQEFQYHKAITQPTFFRKSRQVQAVQNESGRWIIAPGGADEVRYTSIPSGGNFSPNLRVTKGESWVSGPVFGRFEGQESRHIQVTIDAEADERLYVGSPQISVKDGVGFKASSFSDLMDTPFLVTNKGKSATFKTVGKEHEFVLFGRNEAVQAPPFATAAARIVEEANDLFGGLPYDRYVFFGDMMGGYGGLENHASCRMGLWSGSAENNLGLIAHEYFHCFNVKAIRPKSLVDPVFMSPPEVKSLWWLEGVTDYYAGVLLVRAGFWRQADLLQDLSRTQWSLERSTAANTVSAEESSLKVWQSRGSQGWGGLSYYTKGKGVGFLLDLAIRRETQGKASLDDVIKALYNESHGKGAGYDESRIKELVIEVGGEKLKPLYESLVEKPGPMPWDELLSSFGWKRERQAIVLNPEAPQAAQKLGISWPMPAK